MQQVFEASDGVQGNGHIGVLQAMLDMNGFPENAV